MERKNVIYLDNAKDRSRGNDRRGLSTSLMFVLVMLIIYGLLTFICRSPQGVLWRSLYYNTILTMFWIFSIIKRKPLIMTFFADIDAFNGKNRKKRVEFYSSHKTLKYFYGATMIFAFCSSVKAVAWLWLIMKNKIIYYSLIFTSIDILTFILIALEITAVAVVVCKVKTVEFFNNDVYGDKKIVTLEHPMNL